MTYDPFWGTSTPIDSNQFFVSSPYSDAGFEPAGGGGYFMGSETLDDSYWMPSAVESSWWDDLVSGVDDAASGLNFGEVAKLGLGALGAWGSYQDYKSRRDLAEAQMEGDQANRELSAGDDFAKMHALAQIIQARQGINLDPSLAYAQAVRNKMGLSPEGATTFAGVDVGGPMQVGISSADRLDAINRATNVNFAEGGLGRVQGLLAGGSPGQEDGVNARLSHGEYVFDADTVAALGDGNTEAGARELDNMREAIRHHKRSAPASKIPPPSKGALAYLKGK
jgi:hypothetical protein